MSNATFIFNIKKRATKNNRLCREGVSVICCRISIIFLDKTFLMISHKFFFGNIVFVPSAPSVLRFRMGKFTLYRVRQEIFVQFKMYIKQTCCVRKVHFSPLGYFAINDDVKTAL